MKKDLITVNLSDIHTFNRLNPTPYMVKALLGWIDDNIEVIKSADLFIVAGDFFDRGVNHNHPDHRFITILWTKLGRILSKYGVVLRLLEGTKSHDMNQNIRIVEFLEAAYSQLDVKLFKSISYEYIESLDVDLLYVPDNMGTGEQVIKEVRRVLATAGVNAVDIAAMHGLFEYQLPHVESKMHHKTRDYLDIVRYYIQIGHHHTYKPLGDKIIPGGSTDRICHGEEGPKGGFMTMLSPGMPARHKFLENTRAMNFITIELTDDLVRDRNLINHWGNSPDKRMHICLKGSSDHPYIQDFRPFAREFPNVLFTTKRINQPKEALSYTPIEYEDIVMITPENLLLRFDSYLKQDNHPDRIALLEKLGVVLKE